MISFRPVTECDYAFMRALYGSIRAEEMTLFPFTEEQREQFLDQQFHAQTVYYTEHYPGADLSILEEDGQPIGRFFIDRRTSEIRIMDIALIEEARKEGIGTGLIREILEEGVRTGKRVTIHVEGFNPALRLYQRLGFQHIDTNGVYYLMEWKPGPGSEYR